MPRVPFMSVCMQVRDETLPTSAMKPVPHCIDPSMSSTKWQYLMQWEWEQANSLLLLQGLSADENFYFFPEPCSYRLLLLFIVFYNILKKEEALFFHHHFRNHITFHKIRTNHGPCVIVLKRTANRISEHPSEDPKVTFNFSAVDENPWQVSGF